MRVQKDNEWLPTHVKLKDGRQFEIQPLLVQAKQKYKASHESYGLLRNRPTNQLAKTTMSKRPKYSLEDAQWMQDKQNRQIAERYNVSAQTASAIKHYSRVFWGLPKHVPDSDPEI
jgi:hypothetical protein